MGNFADILPHMKKLALILTAAVLVPCLQAQENQISATANQPITTEKQTSTYKQQPQKTPATVTPEKGWQATGLIYEMSDKGLVVISPTAPASMGYGVKANIPNGLPTPAATPEVGQHERVVDGIVLAGWTW